jgi:hypothetical protein
MADRWDLPEFAAGQDQAYTWTLTSDPTDITSQTLELSVRKSFNTPVLFKLTLGAGLLVTNAAQGKMDVHFQSDKTKGLPPGRYVFDLWRLDPGNTRQLTVGTLTLTPPVTTIP